MNSIRKNQTEKRIGQTERVEQIRNQLERFYQPLYLGLWKDQAEWEYILGVQREKGTLEYQVAKYYEENIIMPNHNQNIEIIDTHLLIADVDEPLSKLLQQYKKDVGEYKALRSVGEQTLFSLEKSGSDWWHQELFDSIKLRMEKLENEYQELTGNEFDDSKKEQTVDEHHMMIDLLPKLETHFNLDELRTLCFSLSVNYESIPGDNLNSKVREIILYFKRNNRLEELIIYLRNTRPHVKW